MSGENNWVFNQKRFDIDDQLYFIVDVAIIKGQPIIKTKSLIIYYEDKTLDLSDDQSNLYKLLIKHPFKSKSAIQLINYLSRTINGCNMYDVYDSEVFESYLNLENYIFNEIPRNSLTEISKSFMNKNDSLSVTAIQQRINPKIKNIYKNYNEIDIIPINCYIHSGLKSNLKETIHLMHLGLFFGKMIQSPLYPRFRNRQIMNYLLNPELEYWKNKCEEIERNRNDINDDFKICSNTLNNLLDYMSEILNEFSPTNNETYRISIIKNSEFISDQFNKLIVLEILPFGNYKSKEVIFESKNPLNINSIISDLDFNIWKLNTNESNKIIINQSNLDNLISLIDSKDKLLSNKYSRSLNLDGIYEIIKDLYFIDDHVKSKFKSNNLNINDDDNEIIESIEKIEKIGEKKQENKNNNELIKKLLDSIDPNIQYIYFNKKYRKLDYSEDGRIIFSTKTISGIDTNYIELTIEHLKNEIFKNKENRIFRPLTRNLKI